ncbi:20733_t:CDS:2 [Racocetra persica]|uniref:20733_t:CDS:1 n=1 Tax=Racocetra persica TaxID=160502 RepID=A0ACA9LRA1_9GLOM|nr:20733_t:CDS:2 [Racocetra persica]
MQNITDEEILDVHTLSTIYNAQFPLTQLVSTRDSSSPARKNPPRPPNCFFLLKNAIMLALRERGKRFTMPSICKLASQIWESAPPFVRSRYTELSREALVLHNLHYPNYRFRPQKRTIFKSWVPRNNKMKELRKQEKPSHSPYPSPPISPSPYSPSTYYLPSHPYAIIPYHPLSPVVPTEEYEGNNSM